MRVITVANRKGGVGKTTTGACFAARLTDLGARVLCLDLDGQPFNFSAIAGADRERMGMWDLLSCEEPTEGDVLECIQPTGSFGDMVAADASIDAVDVVLDRRFGREHVLEGALALVDGRYDYAVVDTPPSLLNRTVAALVAADDIVIPTTASADGVSGALGVIDTAAKVRRLLGRSRERGVEVAGAAVVDWLRTNEGRSREEQLRSYCGARGVRVFDTRVRHTAKVGTAQGACESVLSWDPRATASIDYRHLVDEYLALPGRDFRKGPKGECSIVVS